MTSQLIKDKKIIDNDWITTDLAKVDEVVKKQRNIHKAFKFVSVVKNL